jgi:hypothetical protein
MIHRRFSVFSKVGAKYERLIWKAGVADWQQFLRIREVPGLPAAIYSSVCQQIHEWTEALQEGNTKFFTAKLDAADHWQLYREFDNSVRYLDIETTGLFPGCAEVTVVGVFDGKDYEALVAGKNLTLINLRRAMEGCKLLVTYYGRNFDVPFLQVTYPALDFRMPHFDLCFTGRRLGLKGGLKAVEKSLGIERPEEIEHVDGFEAVQLWYQYMSGNKKALDRLITYNQADTKNLARIAPVVYEGLCKRYGA